MSCFYDKAAAHLRSECSFDYQATARIQIELAVFALEALRAFFNYISFVVTKLAAGFLDEMPDKVSRQHAIALWRKELRDSALVVYPAFHYMAFFLVTQIKLALHARLAGRGIFEIAGPRF